MWPSAFGSLKKGVASLPLSPVRRQTSYTASSSRGSQARILKGAGTIGLVFRNGQGRMAETALLVHRQQPLQLSRQSSAENPGTIPGIAVPWTGPGFGFAPTQIFAQQHHFLPQLPDVPVKRVEQIAILQGRHFVEQTVEIRAELLESPAGGAPIPGRYLQQVLEVAKKRFCARSGLKRQIKTIAEQLQFMH